VHLPSGRILDIYTDMPCIFVNTAQNFPIYGKMFFDEEVLKITNISTPNAKFGINGNEQTSCVLDEYKSTSDLEMLPEDEQDEECVIETTSLQSKFNIHDEPILGKSNTVYTKHSGICIRPQLFPDAVTYVSLFSVILMIKINIYV
jgi:aldose 1-epimerase